MKRLVPDSEDARFIRRVLILILIGAVLFAVYRMADLLILAFGSALGAIAIHSLNDQLQSMGVPKKLSLPLAMIVSLFLVSFLVWLAFVQFGPQIQTLYTHLPIIFDRLEHWLGQSPVGAKIAQAAKAAYAGSKAANDVSKLVTGGGEFLLNCLLLLIGALFFAVEPRRYRSGLLRLVPERKRPVIADAMDDLHNTLRLWLRAQLILMTTMGVLVGVGLWIAGVPSSAALGLLAGLSEFIPYVGPTVAMLPALGLAATIPGNGPLIGALVTYAVVRLIQTNFITPYVQNRVVTIPPALTLFAILAIGMVLGLFGLFFAAAILVAAYSLIQSLYMREVIGSHSD